MLTSIDVGAPWSFIADIAYQQRCLAHSLECSYGEDAVIVFLFLFIKGGISSFKTLVMAEMAWGLELVRNPLSDGAYPAAQLILSTVATERWLLQQVH